MPVFFMEIFTSMFGGIFEEETLSSSIPPKGHLVNQQKKTIVQVQNIKVFKLCFDRYLDKSASFGAVSEDSAGGLLNISNFP